MKTGKNAMKKLLTIFLTLILAMSVVACGGSKDVSSPQSTPSSTPEAEPTPESSTPEVESEPEPAAESPEISHDADELQDILVEAYMGLTQSGEGVYYAGSSDGSIGLLMFLDADTAEHYVFVGPIVDNGNGTLTITDEQDGLTLTFGVTAIEDGIELDMGEELGTATLGEVSVEEVLSAMTTIENNTTAITPGEDMSYLNDIITEAYAGVFSDETSVYIANNDDGSFMVVALLSPDMTESISFVGSATAEDNHITITDDSNGDQLTFAVYDADGGMTLDMGDIGEAFVSEVDKADIIAALEAIASETEALR